LSSIRTDVEWAEDAANRRANGEPYLSWADFDESKKSGYNRPFFTYILLFICTVLLITSIALNGWKVEPLNENPMIGPSADTLVKMGAKVTEKIVNENQGWRLLSSTVLHAGLVHYFINMLALWFVGGAIETSHGSIAALIIFIISAVGGTVMSAIFLPEYITVGASGGIFGFIGACLADIIMNWKLLFCDFVTENGKKQSHIVVVLILVVDIALNCVIGLTPFVDNFTRKFLRRCRSLISVQRHLTIPLSFSRRSWWYDIRFSLWDQHNGASIDGLLRHGRVMDQQGQTLLHEVLRYHFECCSPRYHIGGPDAGRWRYDPLP